MHQSSVSSLKLSAVGLCGWSLQISLTWCENSCSTTSYINKHHVFCTLCQASFSFTFASCLTCLHSTDCSPASFYPSCFFCSPLSLPFLLSFSSQPVLSDLPVQICQGFCLLKGNFPHNCCIVLAHGGIAFSCWVLIHLMF